MKTLLSTVTAIFISGPALGFDASVSEEKHDVLIMAENNMGSIVLPFGRYHREAANVLQRMTLPGTGMRPYGVPEIGSPEADFMRQVMAAPAAAAPLAEDELEQLKWQNWAAQNRFESLGPRAQREMAQLYYNNVLPYVASSLGRTAEDLQQEFMVNLPHIGILIIGEQTEAEVRLEEAELLGLTDRRRAQYVIGERLEFSEDKLTIQEREAARAAGEILGRQQAIELLKESGVEFTPEEERALLFTGQLPLTLVSGYDALAFQNKLDTLVKAEHTHAYYFEKAGFSGEWIPTVLVFGYPNNGGACETILRTAMNENPGLVFRCRAAN